MLFHFRLTPLYNLSSVYINQAEMIKHQPNNDNPPIYKKIQNYIFKFSDLLGQGNFSKVYKASKENTSITPST